MFDPNEPIDWMFLNVDTETLHDSETEILEYFQYHTVPVTKRVIMSEKKFNQGLVAIGSKRYPFDEPFSEFTAIMICQKITGIRDERGRIKP